MFAGRGKYWANALQLAPAGALIFFLQMAVCQISNAADLEFGSVEVPMHLVVFSSWFAYLVWWASRRLSALDADRNATVQTLARSEARFRDLLEALPIGVFVGNGHGEIFDVNQAGAAMCGCSRDDIVSGRVKWTDGLAPEDLERLSAVGAEIARSGSCAPFERDLVHPDGMRVPVLMGVKALSTEVNVCYAVDLTERKLREAAVARARTLEEFNRQVVEASRLKSKFLAEMSHELRTPLNAISGFAEVLLEARVGAVSPMQHKFLGHIVSSAHHLQRLIEDVLDISRIEAGKVELQFEETDLGSVIEEACRSFGVAAAESGVEIEAAVDPGIGNVVTDIVRLKQILLNYLSNAIKFTPSGGFVRVSAAPEGTYAFRVDVVDSGIGIQEADLRRLFNAFERVKKGSGARKEGTGLGLAVTRHLARALGGRVAAQSTPGVGSTFSVVLPNEPRAHSGVSDLCCHA